MKRILITLGLITVLLFNNNITSYAALEEDNVIYAGEAGRNQYYKNYLYDIYSVKNDYELTNKEDKIKFLLDKLAIEYLILCDTICWTDNFVFINGDCELITWVQSFPEMAISGKTIDKKLEFINDVVDTYNSTDDWEKINMKFNMWWYSLGENYISYIHILNNIDELTTKINNLLDDDKQVKSLTRMYGNYSYNEIRDHYNEHTKIFREVYNLTVYPQGKYSDINWEYLKRSDD